jgi:thiol-disulfide isomerase/thioredoxin
MRRRLALPVVLACFGLLLAQDQPGGPTNEKAKKIFREAAAFEKKHDTFWALDRYKKADRQDGGRCTACQMKMIRYGIEQGDWKAAEAGAAGLVAGAKGDKDVATAHYLSGLVWFNEGIQRKKDELFARSHEEMVKALAASPGFPEAVMADGRALARMKQDDAAKARFEQYVKMTPADDPDRRRALRYVERPELARARMAPPFVVTTLDGTRISVDDLQGKVVLLDFWATWCGPCREALPRIQGIVKRFEGQPLVVLSVSLDTDDGKWREFVSKNGMSWPQCRDGGFEGAVAKLFGVKAIPHTFTIDADGVLQDEHVGDAAIEGKIKKLLAQAKEMPRATSDGP